MDSYFEGEGTLFFIDDGARLRAYSWRSLYSFDVREMRRASRVNGWTAAAEVGSDEDPAAAGIMDVDRWKSVLGVRLCMEEYGVLMSMGGWMGKAERQTT